MRYGTRAVVTAAVALAAGVGLAAYAFLGAYANKVETARKELAKSLLFRFSPAEVIAGELTSSKGSFRFERAGLSWSIISPIKTGGDSQAIRRIIESVASLTATSFIEVTATETEARYGLDEPEARITFELATGQEASLAIGIKNDFDGRVYVKSSQLHAIGLSDPAIVTTLSVSLYDLRDKSLVDLDPGAVDRLSLEGDGKLVYALERMGSRWSFKTALDEPTRPADSTVVTRLIDTVATARAAAFSDDSGSDEVLHAFGLDEPAFVVRVETHAGTTTLLLGEIQDATSQRLYAKVSGRPSIAELPSSFVDDLRKSPADLEDRRLLGFDETKVARLQITRKSSTLILERTSSGWVTSDRRVGRARELDGIIHAASTLAARRFDTTDPTAPDLSRNGLEPPVGAIELDDSAGASLGRLRIGRTSRQTLTETYVFVDGSRRIAVVATEELPPLPETLTDLLEAPVLDAGP
ncbi:MAG: DUF4340 domain-containing protein [Deltaproteobacteria bacterium]|nr:DUF4340 domain-containing protein [Deltaproteobacteria bacterium]